MAANYADALSLASFSRSLRNVGPKVSLSMGDLSSPRGQTNLTAVRKRKNKRCSLHFPIPKRDASNKPVVAEPLRYWLRYENRKYLFGQDGQDDHLRTARREARRDPAEMSGSVSHHRRSPQWAISCLEFPEARLLPPGRGQEQLSFRECVHYLVYRQGILTESSGSLPCGIGNHAFMSCHRLAHRLKTQSAMAASTPIEANGIQMYWGE